MSHVRQKSSTVFPDLERIADPEIKQVFSDLFKVLQGAHEDSFDDANQAARWEVDGTETQLVTADEVDMQSKKIINVTDPASAQDAATKAYADLAAGFVSGDLILSTVTTARTAWTNVSSTYANKFMRINATPLTTGGADTHTHGAGSYAGPSHTHTFTTGGVSFGGGGSLTAGALDTAHTHSGTTDSGGTGAVTGTSANGSNVPAYVQVTAFKKD